MRKWFKAGAVLIERELTWETLVALRSHPAGDEIRAYFDWKLAHSKPM